MLRGGYDAFVLFNIFIITVSSASKIKNHRFSLELISIVLIAGSGGLNNEE
jgi:hypothetical protein